MLERIKNEKKWRIIKVLSSLFIDQKNKPIENGLLFNNVYHYKIHIAINYSRNIRANKYFDNIIILEN